MFSRGLIITVGVLAVFLGGMFYIQVRQLTINEAAVNLPAGSFIGSSVVRNGVTYTLNFEQHMQLLFLLDRARPTDIARVSEASLEGIEAIHLHRSKESDLIYRPLGRHDGLLLVKTPEGSVVEEAEDPRLFKLLVEASNA